MTRSVKNHLVQADSILSSLEMEIHLIPPFVTDYSAFMKKGWRAVWDTGATRSCVTQTIVDQLQLTQIGSGIIYTATGQREIKTYLVHLWLPGEIRIKAEVASVTSFGTSADVILGMDIISQCDFVVSNLNGKTSFGYQYPSMMEFDFEKP